MPKGICRVIGGDDDGGDNDDDDDDGILGVKKKTKNVNVPLQGMDGRDGDDGYQPRWLGLAWVMTTWFCTGR
jgi:hypothetical protein